MEERVEDYIKRIEIIIETLSDHIEFEDYDEDVLKEASKDKEAIEELLKAYKELKEIEESHRKENGELREKVKQLEEENKTLNERNQYLVKYRAKLEKELYESNENYIPVSLVEEKIEENNKIMQETEKKYKGTYAGLDEYRNALAQNKVLQELLEKR